MYNKCQGKNTTDSKPAFGSCRHNGTIRQTNTREEDEVPSRDICVVPCMFLHDHERASLLKGKHTRIKHNLLLPDCSVKRLTIQI